MPGRLGSRAPGRSTDRAPSGAAQGSRTPSADCTSAACSRTESPASSFARCLRVRPGLRVAVPAQRRDHLLDQTGLTVRRRLHRPQVPRLQPEPAQLGDQRGDRAPSRRRTPPSGPARRSPYASHSASSPSLDARRRPAAPPGPSAAAVGAVRRLRRPASSAARAALPGRGRAAGAARPAPGRPGARGSPSAADSGPAASAGRAPSRSTSPALNLRYPEGVRCGSTSPSASRKRILEMVTSGNSSRSWSSTAPMLSQPRRPRRRCRRRHRPSVFAAWTFPVPRTESGAGQSPAGSRRRPAGTCRSAPRRRCDSGDRVDPLPVDVRAVQAADVGDRERRRPARAGTPRGGARPSRRPGRCRSAGDGRPWSARRPAGSGCPSSGRGAPPAAPSPSGSASTAACASGDSAGSCVWPVTSAS